MPVPSSIETNSAATTTCASSTLGNGGSYRAPTRSEPGSVRTTSPPSPIAGSRRAAATINRSPSTSTTTYSASAATAAPVFDGSVQGVVVHTTNDAPTRVGSGASTRGNRRNTLGSSTVR